MTPEQQQMMKPVPRQPMPAPMPKEESWVYKYRPAIEETAFFARGEFLFWKTVENQNDYAIQGQPFNTATTGAIGKYEIADYGWDPGLRISAGYRFKPHFWQGEAQYTYFHNEGTNSASNPTSVATAPTGTPLLIGSFQMFTDNSLSRATSSLDLTYHVLDFFLARRFLVADSLILKLFMGPTAAWIDEDWKIKYFSTELNSTLKWKWDYSAGGLRAGFSGDWVIGWGFGIFGKFSAAGYVGDYDNKQTQTTTATPVTINNTRRNAKFDDTRFALNLQFQLGLNWGWAFTDWTMKLFAGYEINPWFNLRDVIDGDTNTGVSPRTTRFRRGILAPQGLTVNAQVDY